jgi:hypothetical protein
MQRKKLRNALADSARMKKSKNDPHPSGCDFPMTELYAVPDGCMSRG